MNIDTDEDFPEHPKTVRFCALLQNPVGWAYLWKLWRWCKKFQPDGNLSGYEPAEIEYAVGWISMDGKFFGAAVRAGFIDEGETGRRVHNWGKHLGAGLVRMDIDRLRKASERAKKAGDMVEAKRLDGSVATLRARLALDGTRTSDGRAADVQSLSDGQVPNGAGQSLTVHATSNVSALLCSDLPCSDLPFSALPARDPTAPTPEPEATGRVPVTGYDHQVLFAAVRKKVFPESLPWAIPGDSKGVAGTFAERLSPEERLDVEPTMLLAWQHIRDGADGWTNPELSNPSFAFASWRVHFTQLREEHHGRQQQTGKKNGDGGGGGNGGHTRKLFTGVEPR